MAYTTDAALLADVRDAIQHIVSGKAAEYRVGQRDLTYLKLSELRDMEADLVRKTAPQAVRSGVALARFRRASP